MRINRTITKSYVLDNINEIDIFSEYFDVDDREIEICIRDNLLISSPIRQDDNPSAGFKYNNRGRLKMRDFGGYFWGDCFDAVAHVHNLNVNNKVDFYKILYDISVRFGLIKDSRYKSHSIAISKNRIKILRENVKHNIEIKIRKWSIKDISYWKTIFKNERYTEQYLNYFRIYPITHYWIDRYSQPAPKYYYKSNDPCYAYYFGKDENGIDNIKLYFPLRTKKTRLPRFITNYSGIGGLNFLPETMDFLLITKSYKDVVSLYSFITPFNPNVGIITLSSESTPMSRFDYDALSNKVTKYFKSSEYKAVFTLLDFDIVGVRMSNKMRRDFNTIPFFLTGVLGNVTYDGKDFTDVLNEKGKDFATNIINVTLIEFNKLLK